MLTNQQQSNATDPAREALSRLQESLSTIVPKQHQTSITNAIDQYVKSVQEEAKRQIKSEVGRDIAGYGTLPAILAVIGSAASKEPIVPILLALGGLALTAFVPELREKVNVYNWYEWLQQRQKQPQQQSVTQNKT